MKKESESDGCLWKARYQYLDLECLRSFEVNCGIEGLEGLTAGL